MIARLIACCLCLFVFFSSTSNAQDGVLFEEIQTRPETTEGEWVIGGKKFFADGNTMPIDAVNLKVGNLAVVQYRTKNSKSAVVQIVGMPVKAADINDGPYVMWVDEKTVDVLTMTAGKVKKERIENVTEARDLKDLTPLVKEIRIDPKTPSTPKSDWEAPKRLLAISDLEGNYLHALRFLQNNKVLDDDGHWAWGDGHLVLVGDLVDRGQAVTEVMWLVKRLEREAQAVGGQVHYILGNHEAMVMKNDIRYVHPKYHFVAQRMGVPYDQLFGTKSEIGRWWRTKNGITRVGDLLFVHGGYSPLIEQAKLEMDVLNQRLRDGLAPNRPNGLTAPTNPVEHQHGPFWYRGYFPKYAANWGGVATPRQIKTTLDRHKAKHVVVGHTVVEQVGPIDDEKLVIGVDVKWADSTKCQGLLMEDGKYFRLTMTGDKQQILVPVSK